MNLKEVIADHYGPLTAKTYDSAAYQLFWAYSDVLEAVSAEILYARRGESDRAVSIRRVLDLGIGTGNLSHALLSQLPLARQFGNDDPQASVDVHALDTSPHMMERAREKLAEYPFVEFHPVIGPIQDAPLLFSDQKFDAIYSSFAIHHLSEAEKKTLFQGLRTLLREGGLLVIGDRMPPAKEEEGAGNLAVVTSKFLPLFADKSQKLSDLMNVLQESFDADGDQPSSPEFHKEALREAGFQGIRTVFQSFGCAVVSAIRLNESHRKPY